MVAGRSGWSGGEAGIPKIIQMMKSYSNCKCESVGIYIIGVDKEEDERRGGMVGRWCGHPNTIQTT